MFGIFGPLSGRNFQANYRAMPVAFIDKPSAEFGDKVILPPSALDRLATLHVEFPMLFRVESPNGRTSHCGVLEFVAEEGVVYMPNWMMQNLVLQVGDTVKFTNVSLPKGKYVKLQPVTSDFLDISNPKAVLERSMRSYTCLTEGDIFVIDYNNKNFELEVKEARPNGAISVVETDCEVDFAPPKDYKEPERPQPVPKPEPMQEDPKQASARAQKPASPEPPAQPTFLAFAGTGKRLDGKAAAPAKPLPVPVPGAAAAASPSPAPADAAPSTSAGGSKPGTFISTGNRLQDKLLREKAAKGQAAPPPPQEPKEEEPAGFKPFQGKKFSLKG